MTNTIGQREALEAVIERGRVAWKTMLYPSQANGDFAVCNDALCTGLGTTAVLAGADALREALDALEALSSPPAGEGEPVGDGAGWVYWNPDSGEEYHPDHPVEAGQCEDAERIRRSTRQEDTLWTALQAEAAPRMAELSKQAMRAHSPSPGVEKTGERESVKMALLRAALEPFAALARMRHPDEGGSPSWVDIMTANGEQDEIELRSHTAADPLSVILQGDDFRAAECALALSPTSGGGTENLWAALAKQPGLSLGTAPSDIEGEPDEWVVHRVNGGINDREWTEVARGTTPRAAVERALSAAPSSPEDIGGPPAPPADALFAPVGHIVTANGEYWVKLGNDSVARISDLVSISDEMLDAAKEISDNED